ncbi:hypothetical protein [Microbacterium lacticum]|uniref:hypothetical protein n=1 Tax=Microbacterium lacticum TaxID=33885 RepID=UPI001F5945FE|nr:hypothetical protein [Microbacterium lacticum]
MTTYITFGPDHANLHPHVGAQLNRGYVAIDTGTRDRDIAAALAVLGKQWAFDYQDADRLDARYPDGEIARLTLIGERSQKEIVGLIEATFAAAEGDSNDAEIEALQAVRDWVSALLDYTPAHERDWTPIDAA